MARTIKLGIFTLTDLGKVETAKKLWEHLAQAPVLPAKYDTVERTKQPFTSDSYTHAASLYLTERWLFVTGASRAYQAVFHKHPDIALWDFYFDHKEFKFPGDAAWLSWIETLATELPILYGFFCSGEEYDAKHRVVEHFEGGGSSVGAVGVATREFWQYLPGVYWLNFFGPEAIGNIDLSKVRALEDWQAKSHDSKLLTIRHSSSLLTYDPDVRTESDRKLREALGADHVFSRDEPVDNLHQLPGILKALGTYE